MTDFLRRGASVPQVFSFGSRDLDVTNRRAVAETIRLVQPEVVFHLAAKADTDWCEDHFEEARRVNAEGMLNVLEEALAVGAQVVHFSSACLYPDNSKHHREKDALRALCRYTETKLEAEDRMSPYADRVLTIRMRQPFSNHQHPRNLLQKLAGYTAFIDEPNSMSHLEECVPAIWGLCCMREVGRYNITNEGWTTPLRIAELIKEHCKPDMSVRQITYQELLQRVRAPRVNTLVDCSKLKAKGFALMDVEAAVVDCLKNPCGLGQYAWGRREP
jgi:dTDP-4-dehydrorhamnose reductase